MSWFENLHLDGKGSFRSVEFYVDAAESTFGRRNVLHEYPGRDKPYVDDLGMKARSFRIEAYVIGPDYMDDRDRLRAAIEKPGPGPLIHPYYGEFQVSVIGGMRIRETPREGGVARISFTVTESKDVEPVVAPDLAEQVEEKADAAIDALSEDVEDKLDVAGFIAEVAQAAQNLITGIVSDLNRIKGYVNAAMAIADAVGDAIESLADTISSLILLPGQLFDEVTSIVNGVIGSIASIGDAWDSYFGDDETAGDVAGTPSTAATGATPASGDKRADIMLKAFRDFVALPDDFADVPGTGDLSLDQLARIAGGAADTTSATYVSPQRAQEAINQSAITTMLKGIAVVEACRSIVDIPFASYTKAIEVRDALSDELDALIEDANDITYGPLVDLRVAVVRYLADASADLPRVVEFTPAIAMPALVLAQQLYGDSTRDIELIDRNSIRNPCRVPGGETLEVLSDD